MDGKFYKSSFHYVDRIQLVSKNQKNDDAWIWIARPRKLISSKQNKRPNETALFYQIIQSTYVTYSLIPMHSNPLSNVPWISRFIHALVSNRVCRIWTCSTGLHRTCLSYMACLPRRLHFHCCVFFAGEGIAVMAFVVMREDFTHSNGEGDDEEDAGLVLAMAL